MLIMSFIPIITFINFTKFAHHNVYSSITFIRVPRVVYLVSLIWRREFTWSGPLYFLLSVKWRSQARRILVANFPVGWGFFLKYTHFWFISIFWQHFSKKEKRGASIRHIEFSRITMQSALPVVLNQETDYCLWCHILVGMVSKLYPYEPTTILNYLNLSL